MIETIKNIISRSDKFTHLQQLLNDVSSETEIEIRNVAGSLIAFLATEVLEHSGRQVVLLCSDEDRAEKLRDDCALILGESSICFFGARPAHAAQTLDMSSSIAQIETLKSLATGKPLLIVASPHSITEQVPPPDEFRKSVIEIAIKNEYHFQDLIDKVTSIGFERKNFVESYGDIAVRGGIIDVFPYVGENPIRIEFWGNTVESIREFDVLSQRSIRELQSASIVPSLTREGSQEPETLPTMPFTATLFDHLNPNAVIIIDDPPIIKREIDEFTGGDKKNILNFDDVDTRLKMFPRIIHRTITSAELPASTRSPKIVIDFSSVLQPSFNGSINALVASLEKLSAESYSVILMSDASSETKRLQELINEVITSPDAESSGRHEISDIKPEFLTETLHSGFLYPSARIAIFTEHEIFNRLKRRGLAKRRRFKGFSQKELQQLKRGDYVVHIDHGIGTFSGLVKINIGGIEQEVMKLKFLEDDVLYVNVNSLNRVQKFSSQEGHVPKLTRLGTAEWERIKDRAKKRIKDIARDIIALYAKRKMQSGFAFSADTHWQKELEASFMYEDTVDQATATLDVKRDMESPSPMDRLICGDVGFGKTEVAVRAAFKAVMDGKQVAVLVPTTILAIQHYNTFQDRLSRYATRVEHITRFRSPKEQKNIIGQLTGGGVDIVIGTHRLLSKDIAFKDIGLLIIDEEHRFGVSAKEKLRQLKANVDTLALTATPIPRTLHFSLIGARDLSLIETPPRNRLPIMTEIISGDGNERQWDIVREAIINELHRGGQAYVVHDRVQNIEAIADQVRSRVPHARVHIAHGQMSGHELEKTMIDFLEKKYDVLVCTKIIESGVDIPNVNTIIINRADRFGLAELYQLRGRVGRSNVQAYAYLLTPPLSIMPKQTLRRLQAIEEFTELGSGFNLAMRDLEIRGAGNLLGAEQSGFIMEMGFEMYERIVREAVEELKQEEFGKTLQTVTPEKLPSHRMTETIFETDIEAMIPDVYIESDAERLDIYRRLSRTSTASELQSMREELRDRFGEYPEEVDHLLRLLEIRFIASALDLSKVSCNGDILTVTLPPASNFAFYGEFGNIDSPFQKMMKHIAAQPKGSVQLKQAGEVLTLRFLLPHRTVIRDRIDYLKKTIEELQQWMS